MARLAATMMSEAAPQPLSLRRCQTTPLRILQDDRSSLDCLPFVVKNTFISGAIERSPSLEAFFRERAVRSCPSSPVARHDAWAARDDDSSPEGSVLSFGGKVEHTKSFNSTVASTDVSEPSAPTPRDTPLSTPRGDDFSVYTSDFMPSTPLDSPRGFGAVPVEASQLLPPAMPQVQWSRAAGSEAETSMRVMSFGRRGGSDACLPVGALRLESGLCTTPVFGYEEVSTCRFGAGGSQRQSFVSSVQETVPTHRSREAGPWSSQPRQGGVSAMVPMEPGRVGSSLATLPSAGSAGHASGRCKPCAFLHTKGCANGLSCTFCHVCEPGEKKRRQKDRVEKKKTAIRGRQTGRRVPRDAQAGGMM